MSTIALASSGNGLFVVTITQDDAAKTWTDIQIVNNDAVAWTVSGSIQGNPFSLTVQPGTSKAHTFSPALPLITITNFKGQQVLVPSLDGVNPVAYSMSVSNG